MAKKSTSALVGQQFCKRLQATRRTTRSRYFPASDAGSC